MIDYRQLMEDIEIWPVVERLNIETSYGELKSFPNTNILKVKSPFREDKNINSAKITMNGRYKGRFTDWADPESNCNFIQFVMAVLGGTFFEAVSFIAEDVGGIQNYTDDSNSEEQNFRRWLRPLNYKQLELIGLKYLSPQDKMNNCKIVRSLRNKPADYELEENQFIITDFINNSEYKGNEEPEYLSFEDYINDNPNKSKNASDQTPLEPIYYVCENYKNSPNYLFKEDILEYYYLVRRKAFEEKEKALLVLDKLRDLRDKQSIILKSSIKKRVKEIDKIINQFSLNDEDYNDMLIESKKQNAVAMTFRYFDY